MSKGVYQIRSALNRWPDRDLELFLGQVRRRRRERREGRVERLQNLVAQQLQCSYDDAALYPLFPIVACPATAARECDDRRQRRWAGATAD